MQQRKSSLAQNAAEEGAVLLKKEGTTNTEGTRRTSSSSISTSASSSTSPSLSSSSPVTGQPTISASSKTTLALLWCGQFVSLLGTEISKFSLRIWSYEQSGSSAEYGLVIFFTEMPSILASPLTGPIVDRFNRKWIMMGSDLTAGLATAVLCMMWITNNLQVWHIYIAATIQSCMNALQWPAFMATIGLLVPEQHLVKVNSYNQAASGLAMLLAPTISAWTLKTWGLSIIFLFDFMSLIASSIVTLMANIPNATAGGSKQDGSPSSPSSSQTAGPREIIKQLLDDNSAAYQYLRERPGLLALLLLVGQIQLTNGAIQILFTPLLLSFASSSAIAQVITVSGVGAMAGFIVPSIWKKAVDYSAHVVLMCVVLQGAIMLFLTRPNLFWTLSVSFAYMFLVPISRSCRESIWQRKVPANMQGRLFTLQQSLSKLSLPSAALAAGPLCDFFFEPLVKRSTFFSWIAGGSQTGRGAALLAGVLGLLNMISGTKGLLFQPLTDLDRIED